MFIKNKIKVACKMSGIYSRVVYFRELLFVRNSVLEKLKVKNFLDIQEQICCRALEEGDTLVNVTKMKRKKS